MSPAPSRTIRLPRFFVLNFILLEVVIVGLGGAVAYRQGREQMTVIAQQNSVAVAEHLAFVLDEFYMKPWELTYETYPYGHPLAYEELRTIVLNFLSGFAVSRVSICDDQYTVVFSTDSTRVGQAQPTNSLLLSALAGNAVSSLVRVADEAGGEESMRDYLDVFVPIEMRVDEGGSKRVAFEIFLDVTEAFDSVRALRWTIIVIMTLVGLALLMAVLWIARRADRLITAENAERMRLAEQVRRHNEELEDVIEERTHQLKEAQSGLIQMEKMAATGSLAAGVAHEINNPVSIIQNRLELLLDDAAGGQPVPDLKSHLEMMHRNTSRISEIVSRLLSFARKSTSDRQSLDMSDLLRGVLLLVRKEYQKRGIELQAEIEPSLPRVHGNKTELEQVFINLLVNAMDATPSGGRVTMSTSTETDSLTVRIDDTGHGINEEQLSKIFDPFYTTKGVGAGTGLGLSISYRIITDHGGRIEVASEVGRGTTVRLHLPTEPVQEESS